MVDLHQEFQNSGFLTKRELTGALLMHWSVLRLGSPLTEK